MSRPQDQDHKPGLQDQFIWDPRPEEQKDKRQIDRLVSVVSLPVGDHGMMIESSPGRARFPPRFS